MHSVVRDVAAALARGAAILAALACLSAALAADAPAARPMKPKALAIMSAQAIQAFRNGDFLHAIELFRALTSANPTDALSWQLLGQSYAAVNDPRAAKQAYLKALEFRPEGPVAAATKELLTKLPPPDPGSVKVDEAMSLADWLPLADEMIRQGKQQWVLERGARILAAQGDIPQVQALQDRLVREMLMAAPLSDHDDPREAVAMARQLKALVPGNLAVLRHEGMACHMLRNFECAEASYSKWMQLAAQGDAERGMIARLLLQARERRGLDAGESVPKLGITVLAMQAGDGGAEGERRPWVQSVASGELGERLGLQRGDVILKAGDTVPASARDLQAWSEARPGNAALRLEVQRGAAVVTLAIAPTREELALISDEAFRQYLQGDCEPATARLQELVALQPEDPLSWFLLGTCRQAAKDAAAARAAYTRAMQLGKDTKVGIDAKERLAAMPQPDPYTIQLENGLTVGDWVALRREKLSTENAAAVLAQARTYINRYGPLPLLASLEQDLAKGEQDEVRKEVESALRGLRVRTVAEAEQAFPLITRLKAKKPELPALLRVEAKVCHLILFYSCAEAAYAQWLLAAPAADPRRRQVIDAMFMAQQGKPLPEVAMATGRTLKHCEGCPEMVVIGAGSFEMGEAGRAATMHFDAPFAIARTEVTQRQWSQLMGGNPSEFKACGPDCPVENVSWADAQEYVRRLAGLTGQPYRLPSEAEWEAACRAGEDHDYCGSGDPGEVAWYGAYGSDGGNSGKTTHPVATRRANAWGIHDMSGNVREWVADSWHAELAAPLATGGARVDGAPRKVVKGGSWVSRANELRASHRDWDMAGDRYFFTGFRVALTIGK